MKAQLARKLCCLTVVIVLFAVLPARTQAFGGGGHRIVARLAILELARQGATDPVAKNARRQILKILSDNHTTLEEGAVWPDVVRKTPPYKYADDWHFVSIPRNQSNYDASTQCKMSATAPKGNCVVGGLAHFRSVFMNSPSEAARLDAVRFILHYMGDLHQPLHTSEDYSFIYNNEPGDRGGNYRFVCFLAVNKNACTEVYDGVRKNRNLHATWDKYMLLNLHPNENQYIDELDNKIKSMSATERANLAGGNPAQWAEESHAIAVAAVYDVPKVKTLPFPHNQAYDEHFFVSKDYANANMKRTEEQLIKASLRLASFLKQMF